MIDWGDGDTDTAMVSGSDNPFSYAFNGNHTYSQDGTYFVTVSVADQNGSTRFSSATTRLDRTMSRRRSGRPKFHRQR